MGKPELVRQIKTARCRSVCVCADEYAPQQLKEEAERERESPQIHARPYKRISVKDLGTFIKMFYSYSFFRVYNAAKHTHTKKHNQPNVVLCSVVLLLFSYLPHRLVLTNNLPVAFVLRP